LNAILPKGKEVIWLYGHNHMLALYKKMTLTGTDFVMYPRLIGIGGFPNILAKPKVTDGLIAYDYRTYQSVPDDDEMNQNIGFNGYAKILVSGNNLEISYITAACQNNDCTQGYSSTDSTTVSVETFAVSLATGTVSQTQMYVSDNLVKVSEPADEVSSISCIPSSALDSSDESLTHFD